MNSIPLVDLKAQYNSIKDEIDNAVKNCIEEGRFIGGQPVINFEKELAQFCKVPYCAACGNGTDALEIALKVLGIGKGDEVIVPAMTFIATAEAVLNTGAKLKLSDIKNDTYLLDPIQFEKAISPKTKAVIAVHLYGQMANMKRITEIARKHRILIIEDSAQAIAAGFKQKGPGIYGDIATFSFFPGKNLGAYGDAGAIVTKNEKYYLEFKKIANHGRLNKFGHEIIGRNSRMDTLQAAILSVKLKYLNNWTLLRREHAAEYSKQLRKIEQLVLPQTNIDAEHVYHLYVIRVKAEFRDDLLLYLKENKIEAGIHYPEALHDIEAMKYLGHNSADFPVAHSLSKECISLPIYPELTKEKISYIVEIIKTYFEKT